MLPCKSTRSSHKCAQGIIRSDHHQSGQNANPPLEKTAAPRSTAPEPPQPKSLAAGGMQERGYLVYACRVKRCFFVTLSVRITLN